MARLRKICAVPSINLSESAPKSEPAMAPMLKPACSKDIVARRKAFSTAIPCAFMATSMLPIVAPKNRAAGRKVHRSGIIGGKMKAKQKAMPVMVVTRALPKRLIRTPDSGMAMMAPAAMARSARPNMPVPTASRSLANGICGIQFPSMKPCTRKVSAMAQRALWIVEGDIGNDRESDADQKKFPITLLPSDHGPLCGELAKLRSCTRG